MSIYQRVDRSTTTDSASRLLLQGANQTFIPAAIHGALRLQRNCLSVQTQPLLMPARWCPHHWRNYLIQYRAMTSLATLTLTRLLNTRHFTLNCGLLFQFVIFPPICLAAQNPVISMSHITQSNRHTITTVIQHVVQEINDKRPKVIV
jgi:hypothetical protein